jgi:hypothetical protein
MDLFTSSFMPHVDANTTTSEIAKTCNHSLVIILLAPTALSLVRRTRPILHQKAFREGRRTDSIYLLFKAGIT